MCGAIKMVIVKMGFHKKGKKGVGVILIMRQPIRLEPSP